MRHLCLLAASLYLPIAGAAPVIFDCPRVIDIEQTSRTVDQTWQLVVDSELPPASLATIAVYTQHPSDGGNLVPDHIEKFDQSQVTTWRLPPDSAPYWMACVYTQSRILLAKPIPADAMQCRLTESLRTQQPSGVIAFLCE